MCMVLIVDDEEAVREFVSATLAALGHESVEAKDGLEALLVFKTLQDQISLVIMDVLMPRMDGIAAVNVIKASAPRARVILMSGTCGQLPAEADAFLAKPFRAAELIDTVQQVLAIA